MAHKDFTKPWNKSDIIFIFDSSQPSNSEFPGLRSGRKESSLRNSDDPSEVDATEQAEQNEVGGEDASNVCLYGNRLVLSMWSPVFEAMFEGSFQEASEQTIYLPGKSVEDFKELLEVTHPPTAEVNYSNARQLIPLAHEYQMLDILQRCESAIMKQTYAPKDNNIANLHLATKYDLRDLHEHSANAVIKLLSCDKILDDEHFGLLEVDTQMELLSRKLQYLEGLLFEKKLVPLRRGNVVPVPQVFRHMPCCCCDQHRSEAQQNGRSAVQAGALPKCTACDKIYKACCIEEHYRLLDKINSAESPSISHSQPGH